MGLEATWAGCPTGGMPGAEGSNSGMLIGILGLRRDCWLPFREGDDGDGGGTNPSDGGDGAGGDGSGGDGEDVTGLKNALASARTDAKTSKSELTRLQQRLAELEGGGKSESEQLQEKLKAAEERAEKAELLARETAGKAALVDAAVKARAKYPDLVWKSIGAQLEYDDDGRPTNASALVVDLRKQAPDLFRSADPGLGDAGAGRGDGASSSPNEQMNRVLRRAAGKGSGN